MVTTNSVDVNILKGKKKSITNVERSNGRLDKKVSMIKGCKSLPVIKEESNDKSCNEKSDKSEIKNGKLLFIQFSWIYFDLIVISQILLSISFLMLGFLYFILGSTVGEVMGLVLLFFYLLLPTIPAYKSMANSSTYTGIYAFCFIQLGEVIQNTFILTSIMFFNETLEVKTIKRCYLVGILIIYQLSSIILVTISPFNKVSKVTLKRLFGTSDEKEFSSIGRRHQKLV